MTAIELDTRVTVMESHTCVTMRESDTRVTVMAESGACVTGRDGE